MAVQSYQLFANTIRWSLEDLKNWWISKKKLISMHIGHCQIAAKKKKWKFRLGLTNKQTKEILISKENSLTNKQTKNLRGFHQILVKFYQLFATVLRWSLENFEKKLPRLSFVWREGGRKEERSLTNKQTKKVLESKENSLTNKQTKEILISKENSLTNKQRTWGISIKP